MLELSLNFSSNILTVVYYYTLVSIYNKIMAKQAQRRSTTKAAIVNTARDLFEKQGFDETSISQIVTQANVAKGTFYLYFKTKIDVLLDISHTDLVNKLDNTKMALKQNPYALLVLDQFLVNLCRWYEAYAGTAEALVLASFKTANLDDTTLPVSSADIIELIIAHAIKQGSIRSDLAARHLAKLLNSVITVAVLEWSQQPQAGGELFKQIKPYVDMIIGNVR